MPLEERFTDIYNKNKWHGEQSKSGTGSDLHNTQVMRPQVIELINSLNINNMIDAPCGDFHWMKEVLPHLNIKSYLGVDIVKALIEDNTTKYEVPNKIHFQHIDVLKTTLPKTDLIFCRDCLVHLSVASIKEVLWQFKKSGATYLLTTTFTNRVHNGDIVDGNWRYINLLLPPYNFIEPIELINEGCTEGKGQFTDKSLGLWKLEDITCN